MNDDRRDVVAERDIRQRVLALTGVHLLFGSTIGAILLFDASQTGSIPITSKLLVAGSFLLGILGVPLSVGVFRFSPSVRKLLFWFCLLSLPLFPLGTAFAMGVLRHLRSKRQPGFFTSEYQNLIRLSETDPHRPSFLFWVAVVLLFALGASLVWIRSLPEEVRHMRLK